jgi:predicted GNAT family N-acyltransferase
MITIQNIPTFLTFAVRQPVLREGKPIESCRFDGDDLETTSHFGLYLDEKITSVVSVFKSKNAIFSSESQFQIRGMAVLTQFQRKGFGQSLVKHCEEHIINQNGTLIWFNAREKAVSFYEKLGYQKVGNPFSIADIGIHYIMKKKLANTYE